MIAPELLYGFPFLEGLDENELRSLSIIASQFSYQKGDIIFKEGDKANTLYLLLEGWVDIMIATDYRNQQSGLMMTLTDGEIFGWSAIVEPYLYTASAICASTVKAIGISGLHIRALFEIDQHLCCLLTSRICRVMSNRLRATRLQLLNLFVAN